MVLAWPENRRLGLIIILNLESQTLYAAYYNAASSYQNSLKTLKLLQTLPF